VAQKLTYWSLSTWFTELLPVAPCLLITGPRPEANFILQLLACVVRHGLPLGTFTAAGFQSLPMHVQPTLLIGHVNSSMLKLLSSSNYHGPHLMKDELTDLFCAKAFYAGPHIDKVAFEGAFHIHVSPLRGKLPLISDCEQRRVIADLQPLLVDHRIKHATHVRDSLFDIAILGPESRIVAWVLGSGIIDDSELRARLEILLHEYHDEACVGVACLEPFVIEALLRFSHAGLREDLVYVGELTAKTNGILKDRGAGRKLEPKAVGWMLRNSFGLIPKRDAKGYALSMTDAIPRRIHQLAVEYQVWNVRSPECIDCKHVTGVGDEQDKPAA
jgi:hypothetical protein